MSTDIEDDEGELTLDAAPLEKKNRSSSFHDLLEEAAAAERSAKSPDSLHNDPKIRNYLRFRSKMHLKVCELLKPSDEEEDATRNERLKALFNDLSSKLEPEVSLQLRHPTDNTLPLRYYLMLAEFYASESSKASEIQQLGVALWNNAHFHLVHSLLLYRWLFESGLHGDETGSAKWLAMFIKGAHNLFWLDVENSTRRFSHIWRFVCNSVFLAEGSWSGILCRKMEQIWNLIAKFYPYYGDSSQLLEFLSISQTLFDKYGMELERPAQHYKINAINMFVNEAVRAMAVMKNEVALIKYISDLSMFHGANAVPGRKTKTRLYALLLDLATPGYPLYPTRNVKSAAQQAMDLLFPVGRFWRSIIHFGFRFLRPLSFVHWFQLRVMQAYTYIAILFATILSVFGWSGSASGRSGAKKKIKEIPPPSPSKPPSSPVQARATAPIPINFNSAFSPSSSPEGSFPRRQLNRLIGIFRRQNATAPANNLSASRIDSN
eukprot:TRINITY_DN4094_c0_g1_i1.p1 TRINITY_DN4094_c0_g1~~TRINITY_DN4094_c0_g1_i1.p1  ORF type:complete len:491 (-),score=66.56 TRINITY_DN4094_c0_g1_i1:61-1533(-)